MRIELEPHVGKLVGGIGHVVDYQQPNFVDAPKHCKFICLKNCSLQFLKFASPYVTEQADLKTIDHLWMQGSPTITRFTTKPKAYHRAPKLYEKLEFAGRIIKYWRKDNSFDYGIEALVMANGLVVNRQLDIIFAKASSRRNGLEKGHKLISSLIEASKKNIHAMTVYFADPVYSHNDVHKDLIRLEKAMKKDLDLFTKQTNKELKDFYDLLGNPKSLTDFIELGSRKA